MILTLMFLAGAALGVVTAASFAFFYVIDRSQDGHRCESCTAFETANPGACPTCGVDA